MPSDDIVLRMAGKIERMEGALGRLDGRLTKTKRKTKSLGQESQAWATRMAAGWASVGTAMVGVGVIVGTVVKGISDGVREIERLEKSARLLAALTGSTPEAVINRFAPLGQKFGVSPEDLVGPQGAGFKVMSRSLGDRRTESVLRNIAPAMFLQEAGSGGAAALADIVKRRKFQGQQITGAANVLALASRGSKATAEEYGAAFTEPGLAARSLGIDFPTAAALFSTAEANAADTAQARPQARNFLQNLLAPTGKTKSILQSVGATEKGIDVYERIARLQSLSREQMVEAFNKRGFAIASALVSDPEQIRQTEERYRKAFESPDSIWEKSFDTMRRTSPSTALALQKTQQEWSEKQRIMEKGAVKGASIFSSLEHKLRMRAADLGVAGGAASTVGAMSLMSDISGQVGLSMLGPQVVSGVAGIRRALSAPAAAGDIDRATRSLDNAAGALADAALENR